MTFTRIQQTDILPELSIRQPLEASECVWKISELVRNWYEPLSEMAEKSSKGSVVVGVVDHRLRLRWSARDVQGRKKRFTLAFGSVNATNRLMAERLAKQIEVDLHSGNFDPTLRKYRPSTDCINGDLSIEDLIDRYINDQFNTDQSSSIERYTTLKNHLLRCFGAVGVEDIDEKDSKKILADLQARNLKGETINLYLTLLRAIWAWAVKRGYTQLNPWLDFSVATEPRPDAQPFSREEVDKILVGFVASHYEDFVRFLLGCGCRTGEAIALTWDAISADCSEVWIGRSWDAKGKRVKATKTNKARTVPVSPKIQALLQRRRGTRTGDFVFTSPKGGRIDAKNFLNRHWKPLLSKLEIPYRPPYNSRHTRWSHEIANGMDIAVAARYAGNRPRTMMERYLGATDRPRLKDWD
jgi:integrase